MSYSLALKNGDLATLGSVVATRSGGDKLAQDLDLWLKEIYQTDRFHPTFGSVLESYVGSIISERSKYDIVAEVHRVLTNFQNLQIRRLKNNPTKYTPNELLQSVVSVDASVNYDAVIVKIVYQTGANFVKAATLNVAI